MARIDFSNIKRAEKNKSGIHGIARATYYFFENGGEKYFQLDSYGSSTRQKPAQTSQVIQFNKETAEKLIKLLCKEFDIKIETKQ